MKLLLFSLITLILSCNIKRIQEKRGAENEPNPERIETEDIGEKDKPEKSSEVTPENGFKIDPDNIPIAELASNPLVVSIVKSIYQQQIPKLRELSSEHIENFDEIQFEAIFDKGVALAKTAESVKFEDVVREMAPGFFNILREDPALGTAENQAKIKPLEGPITEALILIGPSLLEKGLANIEVADIDLVNLLQ